MDPVFQTLHDFLYYTKGIAYILMAVSVIGLGAFWKFLTGRDDD